MSAKLMAEIESAQGALRKILIDSKNSGGLTLERYQRYLSMQYHLTRDVQRTFITCAAHHDMAKFSKLREFLIEFALEEEMHYLLAHKDLKALNLDPLPIPLDVKLWQSYFREVILERPMIRLGATCILENIAVGSSKIIDELIQQNALITPKCVHFLTVHRHEELPHGDAILQALAKPMSRPEVQADVELGAREGRIMFLRMLQWCFMENEGGV